MRVNRGAFDSFVSITKYCIVSKYKKQMIDYAQNKRNIDFIEEPSLEAYSKD